MDDKTVKHRLTESEFEIIFDLHSKGVSISKISEQFKVSRPTIYNVLEKMRSNQKNEFFIDSEDEEIEISISNNNFLGVTIDTENGSSDPRINKALNISFNLLDGIYKSN